MAVFFAMVAWLPLALFTVVWALLLLSPLLAFAPKLMATKRRARLDYGRMVGEQGRLVRRRWILGETAAQGVKAGIHWFQCADIVQCPRRSR